ncbi:hypothetical protein LINPERPRIM_LOCUS3944 [Linum perenne]
MDTVGPPTTTAPLPRTARLRTICTILSRMDGT